MRSIKKQSGDTIIEVTLAFVVFALLAIGAISVMNRGVAAAQRSLELTLVRQQVDAQADALRYVHDLASEEGAENAAAGSLEKLAYDDWQRIAKTSPGLARTNITNFGLTSGGMACPAIPGATQAFIMNARTGRLHDNTPPIQSADVAPFSEVVYSSEVGNPSEITRVSGIWIESKRTGTNYVDFHIRACWFAAGGRPATIGTIVRLYDAVN